MILDTVEHKLSEKCNFAFGEASSVAFICNDGWVFLGVDVLTYGPYFSGLTLGSFVQAPLHPTETALKLVSPLITGILVIRVYLRFGDATQTCKTPILTISNSLLYKAPIKVEEQEVPRSDRAARGLGFRV